MAHVDIKITTWERIFIKDEDLDQVHQLLKSGEVTTPNELLEHVESEEVESISEVDEFMTPQENGNQATMELFKDKETLLWDNSVSED